MKTYQVFINNKPSKKHFKVNSLNELWDKFNKWAKDVKFSDSYEYSNAYLGGMAWVIDEGVAEIKES
jgi:hypothetical protein|tara:strand:+ start:132 stop:332 length:201 start_codon:yes stop_codon:yes gene_type:complete